MVNKTETAEMESEESKKRPRSDNGKDSSDEIEVLSVSKKPNSAAAENVKTQVDLYNEALEYEESEVSRRPAEQDQQQFLSTCATIKDLMKEILAIKIQAMEKSNVEVETRRVQIMMLILNLRKLSRTQKVRVRLAREKALDARQTVDSTTLQLQGLLYEALHLQKEAQRCLLAHTADKDIELLPLEQFYELAPVSVSRPDVTRHDPHQQRLARLHWELEQRRTQTSLGDQLSLDQRTIQQQILALQAKLSALGPRVSAILQSTIPLQEALELPLTAMRMQQETAQLLPMPLYTLWMQVSAYSEAGDTLLCCIIRGDTAAATLLQRSEQRAEQAAIDAAATTTTSAGDGGDAANATDSDNDAEDNSSDVSAHKSRQRGSRTASSKQNKDASSAAPNTAAAATTAAANDPIKRMLSLHPLHVEVTVSLQDGSRVVVQFLYATELRFITTRCVVLARDRPVVPGAVVLTDVLSGPDFLDCLFPGDSGIVSPNPATVHQLLRHQLSRGGSAAPPASSGGEVLLPPELGRAYKWAQQLAGLAFPSPRQGEPVAQVAMLTEMARDLHDEGECVEVSSERVHVTLSGIRRRLRARLALQQQLMALQGANSTSGIPVPATCLPSLFPGKVCTELLSWRPLTWWDVVSLPHTAPLREAGLATDRCLYFRAVYQRRHVDMGALVCVSPDYPQTVPLFALEMKWGDQPCPYAHVQQLEAEVNVHWSDLLAEGTERSQLLPLMLYRLAVCLDVYTEAASSRLTDGEKQPDGQHFQKEKIFFRPAKGPDRAFPLKYLPKLRVFAQR